MLQRKRKHPAFTLIELLIVVAIIAILAAIAVPNFLEAQVRSKVSRAKTDVRSVAVALESYAVDNNNYPFTMKSEWLTTPVAYITSLPFDPFAPISPKDGGYGALGSYYGGVDKIEPIYIYHGPNTFNPEGPAGSQNTVLAQKFGLRWSLTSLGPDRGWIDDSNLSGTVSNWADLNPPYDTTNGTASRGNIERIGPGNTPEALYRLVWRDVIQND